MPSDQTALDYALHSAVSYDFFVFPVQPNSKFPFPGFSWPSLSSNNPAQIKAWAEHYPSCNWAVDAGKSKLLILDVDNKNGKPGADSLQDLQLMHGDIPEQTLIAQTPSGGKHIYLRGETVSTVEALGPGLDTRSGGGYALLPGSSYGGKPYTVVTNGQIAPAPQFILDILSSIKTRREKASAEPVIDLDLPHNVERARTYLEVESEPAIEGQGGNNRTFAVAARVRQMGVSLEVAKEILLDHYNPRCCPPWGPQELERIAENAYQYATEQPGSAAPDHAFTPIEGVAPQPQQGAAWITSSEFETRHAKKPGKAPLCGFLAHEIDPEKIPRRQWVIKGRYAVGYITVTVAPPGLGKSLLSIAESLAIISGRDDVCGRVERAGNVLLYNGEDPNAEMQGRIVGAAKHHGIDLAGCPGALHVLTGEDRALVMAVEDGQTVMVNEGLYLELIDHIKKHNIKLLTLDPFVRLHRCNENSNAQMDAVALILTTLSRAAGCAVHVVHHTSKAAAASGSESLSAGRGASAIEAAARIGHNLIGMTAKEAPDYGVDPTKAHEYLRVYNSKLSLAPKEETRWYVKRQHHLPNGDSVGVIESVTINPLPGRKDAYPDIKHVREAITRLVAAGETIALKTLAKSILADEQTLSFMAADDKLKKIPSADTVCRRVTDHILAVPWIDGEVKFELITESAGGANSYSIKAEKLNDSGAAHGRK